MQFRRSGSQRGFSMIELTIVVVIIAIIAAIAIPKMSRGATGANESATMQDLSTMRAAIDLYTTEHGGAAPLNTTATVFQNDLLQYTDINGASVTTKDSTHIYGPYLKSFPTLPVGTNKGLNTVSITSPLGSAAGAWYYDGTTIWVNDATSSDSKGTLYSAY